MNVWGGKSIYNEKREASMQRNVNKTAGSRELFPVDCQQLNEMKCPFKISTLLTLLLEAFWMAFCCYNQTFLDYDSDSQNISYTEFYKIIKDLKHDRMKKQAHSFIFPLKYLRTDAFPNVRSMRETVLLNRYPFAICSETLKLWSFLSSEDTFHSYSYRMLMSRFEYLLHFCSILFFKYLNLTFIIWRYFITILIFYFLVLIGLLHIDY